MRGCRPATDITPSTGEQPRPARPAPRMSMMSPTPSPTLHFPTTGRTSRPERGLWPPATTVKLTLMTPSSPPSTPVVTTPRPPPRPSTYQTTENKNCLLLRLQPRSDPSFLTPAYPVLLPLQSRDLHLDYFLQIDQILCHTTTDKCLPSSADDKHYGS